MRHRRQDKHGHYLYKRALFKVFVGKRVFKIPFVAKPGQGLGAADIEKFEERVIDHIDTTFSRLEFRRVVISPNQVNFIACGQKAAPGEKKDETQIGDNAGSGDVGLQESGASNRDNSIDGSG